MEIEVIPVYTLVTVFVSSIQIYDWYYKISDLELLKVFLPEEIGSVNRTSFLEGEGIGTAVEIPEHIDCEANKMGEFEIILRDREVTNTEVQNYRLDHMTGILYYDIP